MAKWREILEELEQLPDLRRSEGKRHSVGLVILLSILAVISGQSSYRGIGGFVKSNADDLVKLLDLPKARVPSYSTIRRVLMHLPTSTLSQKLSKWQQQFLSTAMKFEWIQIDGKAIKGTVEHAHTSQQDFIKVVSLFYGAEKLTLAADGFHSKQADEERVAKELIKQLDIKGAILTADALHAKKRPLSGSAKRSSIT